MIKISNLKFENNVFLAPMAGVTDIVFRGLCKEMKCGLLYTEMVSAKGIYYKSENSEELLQISTIESPAAVQIFGSDPYIMAQVCETFNDNKDICMVDINMGCPAPKIVKNGEGSAIMKNPKLAAEIVSEIKKVLKKPLTVKFRKGFNSENINAVEFGKILEQAGADAIAVHGRTREQMYEGKADWDIIKSVKAAVKIPVIGNGDIFTAEDAIRIIEATGCDGIMVARGAMGNPWIFKQISEALNGKSITIPEPYEKVDMSLRHLKLAISHYGEARAVREMRKHIAWYLKGLKNSTPVKDLINAEKESEKVIEILTKYKEYLKSNIAYH